MGWVKEHLAEPGEKVCGLIIRHDAEQGLQYAVKPVPDLALQLYEV